MSSDPSSPSDFDNLLDEFQFDGADESWMDSLRRAEEPRELGNLGDYELLESRRGGQGVVYRAWQKGTKRYVALKRLITGVFASEDMRQRFEREIEIAAALNHPNIVRVFGTEQVDGHPILVMEWVEGIPINRWAKAQIPKLSTFAVLRLILSVCDAVQYAHQRGLIHRDLKPGNILVDDSGQPRLLDFGLAKRIETPHDEVLTITDQFVGTPAYAAPEQLLEANTADARADVYSLGVILYELLTGVLPFPVPKNMAELLRSMKSPHPLWTGAVKSGHGPEIDAMLMRALAPEPGRRYQSVDALANDLKQFLCGGPISAHPPSSAYFLKKMIQRHVWRVAFLGALVLGVLAFGIYAAIQNNRFRNERDRAVDAERDAARRLEEVRQQSNRYRALSEFLTEDVLKPALPIENPSQSTLLSALDRASDKLEARLDDHPEARAAIHDTLGVAYRHLYAPSKSTHHLRLALNLHSEIFGDDHPDTLRVASHFGKSLAESSRYNEAEILLCNTLSRQPPNTHESRETMLSLASVLSSTNRFHEAEAMFREARNIHVRLEGRDPDPLEAEWTEWIVALCGLERMDEAFSALEDLLSKRRAGSLIDDVAATTQLHLKAMIHMSRGELENAEADLREVLTIARHAFGEGNYLVGTNMVALGKVLSLGGGVSEEAIRLGEEGLVIVKEAIGTEHNAYANSLSSLGQIYAQTNRLEEAVENLDEVIEIKSDLLGARNPELALLRCSLAEVLIATGDHARARKELERALEVDSTIFASRDRALANLARIEMGARRLDRAAQLLKESLECLHSAHAVLSISLVRLATLYQRKGQTDQAISWARAAVTFERERPEEEATALNRALIFLGRALLESGNLEGAGEVLEEAHERLVQSPPEPRSYQCERLLGRVWIELEQHEDASLLLEECYDHIVASESATHREAQAIVDMLIDLYSRTDQQSRLEEWRHRKRD